MEQKFGKNSIDIEALREFCEREGKEVTYRKGDQMEREGDPARWFGFVTEGCFKYVTYGISDDREHIYKNSLKLVSEFHPRHPIFSFVGGFFVGLSVTLWLGMTKLL